MLKLSKENKGATLAKDLKDGQLAVVIENFNNYKGRIVQKYGDDLVAIGMPTGNSWTEGANVVTLLVRILEEGEILTVTNND